jgi:MFS family permease
MALKSLTPKISNHNIKAFLWHSGFLAFAQVFMDVDTVIPSMLIESGGTAFHIGLMTAIMVGGSSFTQIFFAPYLSNVPYKKGFLLAGINLRIFSLLALGLMLFYLNGHHSFSLLWLIFILITIFSLSGAFANISYIDITGKSILQEKRKTFFSARQIISGSIVLASAFLARKVLTLADYPVNYSYMFFIGGTLLLIASFGFWSIKEVTPSVLRIKGISHFLRVMRTELKENKKLIYFLGFINTQGVAISFMPFVVLYAKNVLGAAGSDTGNFLIFKVMGVVSVSLLILAMSGKAKYRILLYLNVALSLTVVLSTYFITDVHLIKYLFILGGIVYSLYSISMNGVMLEISGQENRALYAGFAGAGNILPAVFPLLGGSLIGLFGFKVFFLMFVVMILLSLWFIRKMDCKK